MGAKNQVTVEAIKLTSYFGNTTLVSAFIQLRLPRYFCNTGLLRPCRGWQTSEGVVNGTEERGGETERGREEEEETEMTAREQGEQSERGSLVICMYSKPL